MVEVRGGPSHRTQAATEKGTGGGKERTEPCIGTDPQQEGQMAGKGRKGKAIGETKKGGYQQQRAPCHGGGVATRANGGRKKTSRQRKPSEEGERD